MGLCHKTSAVLACAGIGSRIRESCGDKLLLDADGLPVSARTIKTYDSTEGIDLLIVVTQKHLIPLYQSFKEKYAIHKKMKVVEGGATRMESVQKGVEAVPEDYEFIAIGDGARPLIHPQDIQATLKTAWETGAAALGVHLTDTVKVVENDRITRTIPRESLVGIQTPQVFRRAEYLELAKRAANSGQNFTDDASIYEFFGRPVSFVEGKRSNIKITLPEDIPLLSALMEEQK